MVLFMKKLGCAGTGRIPPVFTKEKSLPTEAFSFLLITNFKGIDMIAGT